MFFDSETVIQILCVEDFRTGSKSWRPQDMFYELESIYRFFRLESVSDTHQSFHSCP